MPCAVEKGLHHGDDTHRTEKVRNAIKAFLRLGLTQSGIWLCRRTRNSLSRPKAPLSRQHQDEKSYGTVSKDGPHGWHEVGDIEVDIMARMTSIGTEFWSTELAGFSGNE